jgi:hypothetical protein
MTGFSKWWFINGGSIHGLWKHRKYSAIKHLAETLPQRAYEQGVADTQKERDALRAALDRINNIAGNSGDNPMQGLLSIRDEVKQVRK